MCSHMQQSGFCSVESDKLKGCLTHCREREAQKEKRRRVEVPETRDAADEGHKATQVRPFKPVPDNNHTKQQM